MPKSKAAPAAQSPFDPASVFAAFADQSRAAFETWTKAVGEETQTFVSEMARDGAEAFQKMQACKSPMEAIAVEQAWLMARSKAYMDAGRRAFQAAVEPVKAAVNEQPGFRLPD